MRPVGVKEAVRDDPVPFLTVVGLVGIEQQTVEQRFVGKCDDGYYRRDDDNDDGHLKNKIAAIYENYLRVLLYVCNFEFWIWKI